MAERKTCGDCIHADICEQVNGGWFSRKNPAYCMGFKDRKDFVKVVRCKDCRKFHTEDCAMSYTDRNENMPHAWARMNDFCSYGERRKGE